VPTAITRRIPLLRASRAGRRELLTFAAGYLTYFGVRAITDASPWRAFANATALFRVEVHLGIDWEGAVQGLVVQSRTLVDLANAVYIYGHWPVLVGAGVLLFRFRREHYYRLRNVCLLTGAVGLVIFALFPVAPPRLTDLPVIDTITRDSEGYRQIFPPALVNQFAAMPSFHAGWNLLVGIVVFEATRHWLLRAFAVVMPVAMALAVVATANHFVLDVVVGVAIVLIALAIVRVWERRRRRRKLKGAHGRRVAVRRRSSCGQRPAPVVRGRGAGASARRG
jgi:hypothetical protein